MALPYTATRRVLESPIYTLNYEEPDYNESDRIGWAWLTTKDRSPNLTWHNGGTGGYRSFLGFDPKTSQGIIVLAESAISVDDAADVISTSEASVATRHSAQVHGDQAGAHS
ncbi:serine hydrolase [Brevibacterium aurantiacum]|uniref:Beta-lactamase-related domain-containing protein n=1 Tax=Brevibacterium aurantiacum TaxID=273384 RepID=A0A3Q9P2C8_BREAU|nr:serine hydrolase [Brevibacterium aurantiacum]AZT98816.1 hypothetical protein CXR27_18810 [Brevibacterium aurantiacum]